ISREQLENALKRQKESMLRELEETIRVSTKKLDNLANTVGEMIIDQTKFEVYLQSLNEVVIMAKEQRKRFIDMNERIKTVLNDPQNVLSEELPSLMDKHADSSTRLVEKLLQVFGQQQDSASTLANTTDKLQSDIMTLRMLPVSTVFDMFPRTVHDLAKEYQKKIDLEIHGSETEVDKKVLELIKDPLMHLLRNAADHGIEPPRERTGKGKNETGKIILSAWQEGDRIFIRVEDDGKGIDPAAIKEIAVKKGMLDPDDAERMTDEEARHFIFKSGFSTSRIITDVSGRGVGEDVVRKNVEDNLGGQVQLKSAVNTGTSFTLVLPLTLAVTPSVFVKVAGQLFALPAASVLFGLRINPGEIQSVEGKEAITVINSIVPLARMDEVLRKPAAGDDSTNQRSKSSRIGDKLHVVVVEYAHQKIAFQVDELVKEQNIIVKPMEKPLQKVKNIAGVTILEKGEVVPILHVPELMESAKQTSAERKISTSPAEKISKKTQRILIVEDSLTTRELEKSILTSVGYDVDTAVNGVDALNKIFERIPDLIITDVQMPEMDGFQLTKKLRTDTKYQEIPVVMVTALAKDEEKRRGIEAGADAYITKTDFDQANLVETIERLIG
ncbi:MAG: hybrid sensor histidine kinase/response regulator, partial [candidate division WOR-3 bacterium]